MADNLDTVWDAKPHTTAKHLILRSYLGAWTAILSRHLAGRSPAFRELRIIDAFAGPGIYEGGQKGSPILALETVLNHTAILETPIRFTFIESDPARHAILEEQISALSESIAACSSIAKVSTFSEPCVQLINKWINTLERNKTDLGPAFFFLDQFGYSQVPFELVARIMAHPMCECFIFMEWSHLCRFMDDPHKAGAIESAFGGTLDDSMRSVSSSEAPRAVQQVYATRLRESAHVRYVWPFAMRDRRDALTHWLFFCTNSVRGLEEMKKAMLRVDSSGGFSFSDRSDPEQFGLLSHYDSSNLVHDLVSRFSGKEVTVDTIRDFVLTETPLVKFKGVLREMEGRDFEVIAAPENRRSGTYSSGELRCRFYSR